MEAEEQSAIGDGEGFHFFLANPGAEQLFLGDMKGYIFDAPSKRL